jgi:serine phosphatase RsbU (regulator of sigma subunit)/CheY-like chemotaxis protein
MIDDTARYSRHHLRTPLNQIIGYCEMLLEEADGQAQQDAFINDLQRIHAAGRRLLVVVDDMFHPDRSEAYRSNPGLLDHQVRTPLNQIIGYAEMLQEEARERGQAAVAHDLQHIHAAARELNTHVFEHCAVTGIARSAIPAPPGPVARMMHHGAAPASTGVLLFADDNEANRAMLSRRLGRIGHTVVLAENGRQALDRLRESRYDLLLLDMQMPEMNGFDVLQAMRNDSALSAVPVIVLSASMDAQCITRCIQLGAEDYIPKPFNPILLQTRISACLEKKRLRDAQADHLRQIEQEKAQLKQAMASLELAQREATLLDGITQKINAGLGLRQVLDYIYGSFGPILPYDRLGCSLIEDGGQFVRTRFVRSRMSTNCMPPDFAAPLHGTSLQKIVQTGTPRIINDLQAYLLEHPQSLPTQLILQEGMRSSLTCPLVSMGTAVGFLFFNSARPNAYRRSHVRSFMRVANQLATIVQKGRAFDQIGEELHRSEQHIAQTRAQLLAAQEIQRRLLPQCAPEIPGLDIAGACFPSDFTAGDYFDFLPMEDGSLVLVIADVMGHGIGPALLCATVHAHLRSMAETSCAIDQIAARLNRRLWQKTGGTAFVTLILARLDPRTRLLQCVNAGHPSIHILGASGATRAVLQSTALPLGIDPDADFPLSEPFRLETGDLVFLMTDGINEALSPAQEQFGLDRTLRFIADQRCQPAARIISGLRDAICAFTGCSQHDDDLTAVIARITDEP